jgi:ketosteroid isomerase-like protein
MLSRAKLVALVIAGWSLLGSTLVFASSVETTKIGSKDAETLRSLFKDLIEAENRHDLKAVRSFLVASPDSLFISKTEPLTKGDWGPYWGAEQVMGHFQSLYKSVFRIDPDYSSLKIVGLTPDVAELYVPIVITTDYSFTEPKPTAARMVLVWLKTSRGWKMATDIPLPVVLSQASKP